MNEDGTYQYTLFQDYPEHSESKFRYWNEKKYHQFPPYPDWPSRTWGESWEQDHEREQRKQEMMKAKAARVDSRTLIADLTLLLSTFGLEALAASDAAMAIAEKYNFTKKGNNE